MQINLPPLHRRCSLPIRPVQQQGMTSEHSGLQGFLQHVYRSTPAAHRFVTPPGQCLPPHPCPVWRHQYDNGTGYKVFIWGSFGSVGEADHPPTAGLAVGSLSPIGHVSKWQKTRHWTPPPPWMAHLTWHILSSTACYADKPVLPICGWPTTQSCACLVSGNHECTKMCASPCRYFSDANNKKACDHQSTSDLSPGHKISTMFHFRPDQSAARLKIKVWWTCTNKNMCCNDFESLKVVAVKLTTDKMGLVKKDVGTQCWED